MNLSSIAIAAFLSSLSSATADTVLGERSTSEDRGIAALKLRGAQEKTAAGSGIEKGRQLKKKQKDACGPETENSCVATTNVRSPSTLVSCLNGTSSFMDTPVTIIEYPDGTDNPFSVNKTVSKLTFPQVDFDDFTEANFNAGIGGPRFPAGIFYAEGQEEVIMAVNCARDAGYKVSPRGRGHSYQGLSSMDGYLVIDLSLMCVPDNFTPTTQNEDHPWLLGGEQKVIGTIKSGSGCTNAVMLAYTAKHFPDDGIYLIGGCPSVGITGYATGGGQGDTTPWVGLGVDDVLSYDIVLYDGTSVTASEKEHSDLYWALRGGGSGFGVITSLTTAIVNAPKPLEPSSSSSSRFTYVFYSYKQTQNEAKKFLERFQDFLVPNLPFDSKEYKDKIRNSSARFGGDGEFSTKENENLAFTGIFLGSKDEAISTFEKAGLRDTDIFKESESVEFEFSSHAEVQLFSICFSMSQSNTFWNTWTSATSNVCDDLGIDPDEYCHTKFFGGAAGPPVLLPNCDPNQASFNLEDVKNVILPAIKAAAIKPQSWFNRPGSQRWAPFIEKSLPGGLLVGRLDPDVLLDLANVGVTINHFAHGAPTVVARDKTGYSNREEYILLSFAGAGGMEKYEEVASILINKAYGGDSTKLRGYINYMNPVGTTGGDWRTYYFGDNYERLSEIKAKYDVTNGFGNPVQVRPALSKKAKAGK